VCFIHLVSAVCLDQWQPCETHIQVALNGAQVHPEFIGKRLRIKRLTLIELGKNFGQAINKRVMGSGDSKAES
jgi:hypothetical protein